MVDQAKRTHLVKAVADNNEVRIVLIDLPNGFAQRFTMDDVEIVQGGG